MQYLLTLQGSRYSPLVCRAQRQNIYLLTLQVTRYCPWFTESKVKMQYLLTLQLSRYCPLVCKAQSRNALSAYFTSYQILPLACRAQSQKAASASFQVSRYCFWLSRAAFISLKSLFGSARCLTLCHLIDKDTSTVSPLLGDAVKVLHH